MKNELTKMTRGIVIPTSILTSAIMIWVGYQSVTTYQHGADISGLTASISDLPTIRSSTDANTALLNSIQSELKYGVLPRLQINPSTIPVSASSTNL